jgi:integrase/recombinase XerD
VAGETLESAVQRFLDHLRIERGLAVNTLEAYGTDLARFVRQVVRRRGERVQVSQVEEADVLAYLTHLADAGMAAKSQARHLTTVRSLFRHLLAQELIAFDPTAMVELPHGGRPLPSLPDP